MPYEQANRDAQSRKLSAIAEKFTDSRDWLSVSVLIVDWLLYFAAITATVLVDSAWMKLCAAIAAGTAISMLFILGHDAAHRTLVSNKKLNAVLARIVFLPCLHNYTLWVIQHNRLHHQSTNVRGLNSYSPLSLSEFSQASIGRRALERIYRTPFGFGIYYLIKRWWADKFFPRMATPKARRVSAWIDFSILILWIFILVFTLLKIDAAFGDSGPIATILWGLILPFVIWNQLMGTTAFLQHTHPLVPWYLTQESARASRSQAELTVLVQYPAWYDVLSHNIMQHQAHHVSARIPWFRLKSAQRALTPMLGPDVVVERMGLRYIVKLVRQCQLYDYGSNKWVKFPRITLKRKSRDRDVAALGNQEFSRNDQLSFRRAK
jgi:acyl-lipid omega-6 desaturase (Delta-12 desaturase)